MSWLKIDDKFADSPKVDGLSDAAARLWIMAACWCRKPENVRFGGMVPEAALDTITRRRWPTERVRELVRELVDATVGGLHEKGLWEPCDGGWVFHDWNQFQPPETESVSDKARRAGLASAEARRNRDGTAVPKGARNRTSAERVRATPTEPTEPPDPDPDPDPKSELSCQSRDLTGIPKHVRSSPRHDDNSEPQSEPETQDPSGTELAATESSVRANRVQPEPREPKPISERQPVALPTRAERVRTELSELPIGELAKKWRENPTWVAESSPQSRPELLEVEVAWDRAVGLRPTPLGHATRDPCTRALLQLYADGVPQAALLRACEQAGRTDWICGRAPDFRGQVRKRRVSTLTMGVLRELLDAAPTVQNVSPAVAAIVAEKRKEAV